jgi:small subunit ribosomal protein S20
MIAALSAGRHQFGTRQLTTLVKMKILARFVEHRFVLQEFVLANSPQAAKRARQSEARRQSNAGQRNTARSYLKRVHVAIDGGDKTLAQAAFKEAEPLIDRAARKGLLEKNAVARYKSRLSAKIKALSA